MKTTSLLTEKEVIIQLAQFGQDGMLLKNIGIGIALTSFGGVTAYLDSLRRYNNAKPIYGTGLAVALCDDLSGYEEGWSVFNREADSRRLLELELRNYLRDVKQLGLTDDRLYAHSIRGFKLSAAKYTEIYKMCRDVAMTVAKRDENSDVLYQGLLGRIEDNIARMYANLIAASGFTAKLDIDSQKGEPLKKNIRLDLEKIATDAFHS